MANIKGRGITVEIASAYGTLKTVSEVTEATTGVATSTAHGLTNNTVGYWQNVVGMPRLEGQATRCKNVATNTFELQGVDTTTFGNYTAGEFVPVTGWAQLLESTAYSIGGGAGEKLNATRLIDTILQEEQGNLPAANVTMSVLAQDTPSAAMQVLLAAVQQNGFVIGRITFSNGAVRIFRGQPSLPGEDVQQGQLGTGSLDFAVKGLVLALAA